ncbi:amino acid ABC transporter substrate-binding protein [Thalassotalea sp. LPB0316]|uniref:substrate-binding periplasmic protein n=1 Tax=Thalassotalea sp. LPB0316 TaxID=2769490 RepID=UPI0018666572|nr:transporter substrate-binding domain-containing protein [Thalassotalea sp. LPB0316]QOL25955.1 amino acid ABC transporter substrate-binding protein [Thalassotalea sp. LPB0316]
MKYFLVALLISCFVAPVCATTVRFAVGPDHQEMMDNNYSIYRANWEFMEKSLDLLGAKLVAKPMPWARAKAMVQSGTHHGLFLAANFAERNEWAVLSVPLGYEVFGCFLHKDNPDGDKIIGAVRLGGNDRILSYLHPEKLLNVATAQDGLMLLNNKRIDRFIMAKGYGKYLLDSELTEIKPSIIFDPNRAELRSLHIAFAKDNAESVQILKLVDQAIELGMNKGLYTAAMEKYQVSTEMRVDTQG